MHGFRAYLASLPDELLESVTEDYTWLAGFHFGSSGRAEFAHRRDCCHAEGKRRRAPARVVHYFKILNMFEKSSVQTRKGRPGFSTLSALFSKSGYWATAARSMIRVHEQEKQRTSSSSGVK
jgi:hypothetical protein